MLCIRVIKAWSLPETLGDTNPFVILDWGELGVSRTQVVDRSTSPTFNCDLRFRWPSKLCDDHSSESENVLDFASFMPKVRISIYNKHSSISDELLGCALLDAKEFLQLTSSGNDGGNVEVYSFPEGTPAGVIELKSWKI